MSERVAVQKIVGNRAGVETSPVRRPESPAKQTPAKTIGRNSTLRASTASSANRTSKSQGTAKKPKAAAPAESPAQQSQVAPRSYASASVEPHVPSAGAITELKALKSPPPDV